MKRRFLIVAILTMSILGSTMSVSAVTPRLSTPPSITIPKITVTLPDGVKDSVKNYVDNNVHINLLTTPTISKCTYVHSNAFYQKNRLQVEWNSVEDATSYEVLVTKKDGTEHTYKTTSTHLIVNKGSDNFVDDCMNGGTVKVRAVKNDNEVYSLWTNAMTISCNTLHFK